MRCRLPCRKQEATTGVSARRVACNTMEPVQVAAATLLLLLVVAPTLAEQGCGGGAGATVFDKAWSDPELAAAVGWWRAASGAANPPAKASSAPAGSPSLLSDPAARLTVFIPRRFANSTAEGLITAVEGIKAHNGGPEPAALYTLLPGVYNNLSALAGTGSINTVLGVLLGLDYPKSFSWLPDGKLALRRAWEPEGVKATIDPTSDHTLQACNGVLHVTDEQTIPFFIPEASLPPEPSSWAATLTAATSCVSGRGLVDVLAQQAGYTVQQGLLGLFGFEPLLRDPALAATLFLVPNEMVIAYASSFTTSVTRGIQLKQGDAQTLLYWMLPKAYCAYELAQVGAVNTMAGVLQGQERPLAFSLHPATSQLVVTGGQGSAVVTGVKFACNSIIYLLDGMPLPQNQSAGRTDSPNARHLPGTPLVSAAALKKGFANKALPGLDLASLGVPSHLPSALPRHMACLPPPFMRNASYARLYELRARSWAGHSGQASSSSSSSSSLVPAPGSSRGGGLAVEVALCVSAALAAVLALAALLARRRRRLARQYSSLDTAQSPGHSGGPTVGGLGPESPDSAACHLGASSEQPAAWPASPFLMVAEAKSGGGGGKAAGESASPALAGPPTWSPWSCESGPPSHPKPSTRAEGWSGSGDYWLTASAKLGQLWASARLPQGLKATSDEMLGRGGSWPASKGSSELELLAQLPSSKMEWAQCVVDFECIAFAKRADGSLQQLGSGAYSTVYKVTIDGVEPAAAKVVRLGPASRMHEMREMFVKEVGLLCQLRHRSIVAFIGVCFHADCGIILMELAEGGDLYTRLNMRRDSGERVFAWRNRGKHVALDIAAAVYYLQSQAYSHFDLKSTNVLLTRDLTAKLADVGLARALRATHYSTMQHTPGTFDYMAPEVLMGQRCSHQVDIYSFGVLLWEICSGERPVRACLRPLRVPEECPPEVDALYQQCMSLDPAQRPTAQELVQRLASLVQSST